MTKEIVYREMQPGEEPAVCDLVRRVFDACIADEFEDEGVTEFFRFADPRAMQARMGIGGFVLLAARSGELVGMVEFAPLDRIAMMFVELRRQGIAKTLLERAIGQVRADHPIVRTLTVHSSLRAKPIYRRMGFRPVGNMTKKNGITYVPMERDL